MDLEVRNHALLNKWIWRYGKKRNSLWKKVVMETKNDPSIILRNMSANKSANKKVLTIQKRIINPSFVTNKFFLQVISNIGFTVGNSENIVFWHEEWIEKVILERCFLKIFALATNKSRKILDYGKRDDCNLVWDLSLRKSLFY